MLYNDFMKHVIANDGADGAAVELAVKSYLFGRTVTKVQSRGKKDAYFTVMLDGDSKRKVTIEIKTACGRIDDCAASQFIVYWAEPDAFADVEFSAVVFTKEEWKDFVSGYTGRGSFVRHAADGDHIQSFRGLLSGARPKASKPIAEYIYSVCENQPTLAEWKESVGR